MSLEQLYQTLGNSVANAVPDNQWITAQLTAVIETNDHGILEGKYQTQNSQWDDFRPNTEMYLVLTELRNRMQRPDRDSWTKATFILQPGGQFDLQVSYPDQ